MPPEAHDICLDRNLGDFAPKTLRAQSPEPRAQKYPSKPKLIDCQRLLVLKETMVMKVFCGSWAQVPHSLPCGCFDLNAASEYQQHIGRATDFRALYSVDCRPSPSGPLTQGEVLVSFIAKKL